MQPVNGLMKQSADIKGQCTLMHPILSFYSSLMPHNITCSGGNFGGLRGQLPPPPHLSSNCQFVGNFHFIGSLETHELFYKTVIISKFPTN